MDHTFGSVDIYGPEFQLVSHTCGCRLAVADSEVENRSVLFRGWTLYKATKARFC